MAGLVAGWSLLMQGQSTLVICRLAVHPRQEDLAWPLSGASLCKDSQP